MTFVLFLAIAAAANVLHIGEFLLFNQPCTIKNKSKLRLNGHEFKAFTSPIRNLQGSVGLRLVKRRNCTSLSLGVKGRIVAASVTAVTGRETPEVCGISQLSVALQLVLSAGTRD